MTNLETRVLATLQFFDLQDLPLTHFEIYNYLLVAPSEFISLVDSHFEVRREIIDSLSEKDSSLEPAVFGEVLAVLTHLIAQGQVEQDCGYYAVSGRENIISERIRNYGYGLQRERRVKWFLTKAKYIPFIRGIALAGSQPLGQQRATSDIDLFIITDPRFMWMARTLLTMYFQILGMRRHGKKVANRFCLNHYLATIRMVDAERNLYKAMEYWKLRPVVGVRMIRAFQEQNAAWMQLFFSSIEISKAPAEEQPQLQSFGERIIMALGGAWIEKKLGRWQLRRIRQDKYTFVREDELSFHPGSKHEVLLAGFFERHK